MPTSLQQSRTFLGHLIAQEKTLHSRNSTEADRLEILVRPILQSILGWPPTEIHSQESLQIEKIVSLAAASSGWPKSWTAPISRPDLVIETSTPDASIQIPVEVKKCIESDALYKAARLQLLRYQFLLTANIAVLTTGSAWIVYEGLIPRFQAESLEELNCRLAEFIECLGRNCVLRHVAERSPPLHLPLLHTSAPTPGAWDQNQNLEDSCDWPTALYLVQWQRLVQPSSQRNLWQRLAHTLELADWWPPGYNLEKRIRELGFVGVTRDGAYLKLLDCRELLRFVVNNIAVSVTDYRNLNPLRAIQLGSYWGSRVADGIAENLKSDKACRWLFLSMIELGAQSIIGSPAFRNSEDILLQLFRLPWFGRSLEMGFEPTIPLFYQALGREEFLHKGVLVWLWFSGYPDLPEVLIKCLENSDREWSLGFWFLSAACLNYGRFNNISRYQDIINSRSELTGSMRQFLLDLPTNFSDHLSSSRLVDSVIPEVLATLKATGLSVLGFNDPSAERRWGQIAGFEEYLGDLQSFEAEPKHD